MTTEPTIQLHKFSKGEQLQVGTSPHVYTVTHDETKTGIVRVVSDYTGMVHRFNSNKMDLTLYVPEVTTANYRRTPEHIRATLERHANTAADDLDRLAQWATELARTVRRAPTSGYGAHAGVDMLTQINARLAKVDALFTLIEKD